MIVRCVAVCGPGEPDEDAEAAAEEVGRRLGERGALLVCGGLGGVMEAACRGAKAAGGTTLGILPGLERRAANPYVDVAVATGMGEMRNALVVRTADVVIAIAGGYGTLSEIALALRGGVPVVGLGTWDVPGVRACSSPAQAVEAALAEPGTAAGD